MNEPRLAAAAREYVAMLDVQQDMKPLEWSQEDHTREFNRRMWLLAEMREALTHT